MRRLVAVSNRVAVPKRGRSAGGLAVGLLAALREHGGMWFGASGKTSEEEHDRVSVVSSGRVDFATVDIVERDYDAYYNGFSNNTLWPLFHSLLGFFSYSRDEYHAYRRVNEFMARRLASLLQPDDLIWVHDYHLLPLAIELRRLGIRQPIGFFLHVPFPGFDVLRTLPCHDDIVRGLAAYDVVGVQTQRDLRAFRDCITQPDIGGSVGSDGRVEAFGRRFVADAFPIGIDVDECSRAAVEYAAHARVQKLAASLHQRTLLIGVDRLDYSKGLVLRFRAMESLFVDYPAMQGRAVYMQIAPPTRAGVRTYQEIRHGLERVAGNINGRYADIDYVPIRYMNRAFDRNVLLGIMRVARVGLVTPIRDGMNLVAKEYLASQDPEDPGVLVLSRLCGAAAELVAAVLVNPYDVQGVAHGIARAIAMPLDERRARHRTMLDSITRHDVHDWSRNFIGALTRARLQETPPSPLRVNT